ncbi:MAG: threonine aldolase family protein [Geminicoccaceae bacterium]
MTRERRTSIRIDLISDTAAQPTPAMRRAMAKAPTGDEQRGEDPSVNRLCERAADLLGKEAALFLPSGIMCNQVALAVHCRAGDEVLAASNAHVLQSEGAAVATITGALVTPIDAQRGMFQPGDLARSLRRRKLRAPRPRVACIEQTSNRGGGSVWPLAKLQGIADIAGANGLAMHLDGARLMNAVVASGVPARAFAAPFDSVWLGLTKGLGCPVGAVLAGDRDFIDAAWWWKHRLGGAMRQAGILAAAGLHALDHHVDRLEQDHGAARELARRLQSIPGIDIAPALVETNIVLFDLADERSGADDLADYLLGEGIRVGVESGRRLRAVTHLGIQPDDLVEVADSVERYMLDMSKPQG